MVWPDDRDVIRVEPNFDAVVRRAGEPSRHNALQTVGCRLGKVAKGTQISDKQLGVFAAKGRKL